MIPKDLDCISALVGSGGNLGTVIACWCLYMSLGPVDNLPWPVALRVLIGFSLFAQMADGISYGTVLVMIPKQLACV